jgi:hypothetical protein
MYFSRPKFIKQKEEVKCLCRGCGKERKTRLIISEWCGDCMNDQENKLKILFDRKKENERNKI